MISLKIQTLYGNWITSEINNVSSVYADDGVIYFSGIPCKLSTLCRDTGIIDASLQKIYEGDDVLVHWIEFINGSESEFERDGVVKYMADGITAAWFVEFDKPVKQGDSYECERQMLLQTNKMDGSDIWFFLIARR